MKTELIKNHIPLLAALAMFGACASGHWEGSATYSQSTGAVQWTANAKIQADYVEETDSWNVTHTEGVTGAPSSGNTGGQPSYGFNWQYKGSF